MDGTAASVKRVTIASAEYADELVALIERDEALGMAVGQLMARYEGLDIKTAEHIVQNRGVAAFIAGRDGRAGREIRRSSGLTGDHRSLALTDRARDRDRSCREAGAGAHQRHRCARPRAGVTSLTGQKRPRSATHIRPR